MTAPRTLDILLDRVASALTDLAQYEPADLAETRDLLVALLGGTDQPTHSLIEQVAQIAQNLGSSWRNPAVRDLPGLAADLLQAVTAYASGCVAQGMVQDYAADALTAIDRPWSARSAEEFFAGLGVSIEPDVDHDTDPEPATAEGLSDEELEARLDALLAKHPDLFPAARPGDDGEPAPAPTPDEDEQLPTAA